MDLSLLPPYRYTPLGKYNIRLLVIEKEPWDAPYMSCRLEYCLSSDLGDYHAISYVWGEPSFTSYIILDDHGRFPVTDHLYKVLRKMRQSVSQKLWVDAICINQHDDPEKSQQIQLMHMIYSRAAMVHVVLGDHLTVKSIHTSAFWERSWVVQEVLLARRIRVHLSLKCRSQCLDTISGLEQDRKLCQKLRHNPVMLETMAFKQRFTEEHTLLFDPPSALRVNRSILNLLLVFRQTNCADDRDRIFALLPAAADICCMQLCRMDDGEITCPLCRLRLQFRPIHFRTDYSLTTESLYRNFARVILEYPFYQYLILDYAVHLPNSRLDTDPSEPHQKHLPSWVPDWRVRDKGGSPDFFGVLPAVRCTHRPLPRHAQQLRFEDNLLVCQAFILGTYHFEGTIDRWIIKYSKTAAGIAQEYSNLALTHFELLESNLEEASWINPEDGDMLIWLDRDPHMTIIRPDEEGTSTVSTSTLDIDDIGTLIGRLQMPIDGFPFSIHSDPAGAYEMWISHESEQVKPFGDMSSKFRVQEGLKTIGSI